MTMQQRVLGRLRLSRATDESTSIERQREVVQAWSDAQGHQVVGWAEDSDVTGALDPFQTPEFGSWLRDRAPEFDVIACWKLDRLGRDAVQLNKLFGWCQDHQKTIVSATEAIDLGSWSGRMLANVIGGLAEGELSAMKERASASRAKLRDTARWGGGRPPFGYKPVQRPEGGWTLVVDPPARKVVQRIVGDLLDGRNLSQIARALGEEGYLAPAQYYRSLKSGGGIVSSPDETRGTWNASAVRNLLRSKSILGHVCYQGQTVRDDDGRPLMASEPLVSLDEWERVQVVLDRAQQARREAAPHAGVTTAMLSGLAFCYFCQVRLTHDRTKARGKLYRYYRCSTEGHLLLPAEDLELLAEEAFLNEVGELEVRQRVWVPGDAREAELREAVAALDDLTALTGTVRSATARERLQRQIAAIDNRIVELESEPAKSARWEYQPTGQLYSDSWAASPERRRELMVKSGITIHAGVEGRSGGKGGSWYFRIFIPEEIREGLLEL